MIKIRLVDSSVYAAMRAEIINGRLEIDMKDKSAEEVQTIFSELENLEQIDLLTEAGEKYGNLVGWTKYGGVMLNGDMKTAILAQSVDATEKRLTTAESNALSARIMVEDLKENGIDVKASPVLEASVKATKIKAQEFPDEQALQVKALYDSFDELVKREFVAKKEGYKFTDGDDLYKTAQDNVKFEVQYRPGSGMESLYTRIDETHAGTLDDPIPYKGNMTLENGRYYIQDGVTYKCNRDTEIPVHQTLKDLVGIYVEVVE